MSDIFSFEERQNSIVDLLKRRGRLSVAEIVEQFQVSEATARRDLEILAGQGRLQRVYGGALPVSPALPERPILLRGREQSLEKQRIGQAAAGLINAGETVFLGSGTTVLEVARHLPPDQGLTIITNSLPVLNELSRAADITLVALGGMMRSSELSFIGHIAEQALAEVRADKVIIGIHAISLEQGLTSDYLPETMTDRAIIRAGREVIVVADHTKVNTVAAAFLAPVTSIHRVVTDSATPQEFIDGLEQRGLTVQVV